MLETRQTDRQTDINQSKGCFIHKTTAGTLNIAPLCNNKSQKCLKHGNQTCWKCLLMNKNLAILDLNQSNCVSWALYTNLRYVTHLVAFLTSQLSVDIVLQPANDVCHYRSVKNCCHTYLLDWHNIHIMQHSSTNIKLSNKLSSANTKGNCHWCCIIWGALFSWVFCGSKKQIIRVQLLALCFPHFLRHFFIPLCCTDSVIRAI